MYDDAKKYRDSLVKKWDDYYRVYKGQRVLRHYEGVSDPVIREAHTIIETLVANIAGGNPEFHFVKTNEEQADDTSILNGMLDYFMLCNQIGLKNQEWVREMLLNGTGTLHVSWVDGKPLIENIPLRNFFVSPTATSLTSSGKPVARYAGHEYLLDISVAESAMAFDANEVDPETSKPGRQVKMYKNIDKIKNMGQTDEAAKLDKAFKDSFNSSTLGDDAAKSQIHVIRLYDLDSGKLMEIGNRKEFIRYIDTPCQREEMTREVMVEVDGQPQKTVQKLDRIAPFLPYAVLRDYVDTSLFYGDGEMAVILGDAELLNDLEAMDLDNIAYQNTPMYTIDPQFADLAPEIETIPGAVYPIPKNALASMPIAELAGDLDSKKERVASRMRRDTAADEAVQGVSQDKGRVTATEVNTTIAQAQNRFSTKISNLESEGYAQLASVIVRYIQIFMTQEQAVRIVGPQGVKFKDYDPWEYNGEWEPHVKLDSRLKQEQLEVGLKNNQIYQEITNDPMGIFDPVEAKRFILQHIDPNLDDEKFNALLKKQAPAPPPPLDDMAKIYATASPAIKAQIEQALGLQPDPMHAIEMETAAMQHANTQHDAQNPLLDGNGSPVVAQLPPPAPVAAKA